MIENDLFKALADPTRRAIFEKLAHGSMNASDLRQGMTISQPAIEIGERVMYRLCREIERGRNNDKTDNKPELVPHRLIVRESVAPP